MIGCLVGCSGRTGVQEAPPSRSVYVRAMQEVPSGPSSRTYIGGEALDRTLWSELDEISVYWRPAGGDGDVTGHPFGCYRIYADEALFSATIPDMAAGEYTYYAACPAPATVSGTSVTYTLPAVQDGTYDMRTGDIRRKGARSPYAGNYDFMLAAPVAGEALTGGAELPALRFYHQCHVMRIQVPTGRNRWGADVTKLRVQFPADVVGDLTMDMAKPFAAPVLSNGVSTVWAHLSEPFTESSEDDPDGRYVWLFLCPAKIDGDVTFTAYDDNGYQSQSITIAMNKTLEAGKITPVNLTVPQELPLTWIDFSITGNNLGEEPQRVIVKAPEGGKFRNGTDTCSFVTNADNKYSLAFYNAYDGLDNGAILRDGEFTFTYDSENAIVSESRRIGDFTPQERTSVELTVPYLFHEDFAGVGSQGKDNFTSELSGYGLTGWSGSNFILQQNVCACLSAYIGSSVQTNPDKGTNTRARLDTPLLTGIKEGKSVTLSVSFDIGGTKADGTLSNHKTLYSMYEFGSDTKTGAVEYTQGIGNVVVSEDAGTDGSYTNLPLQKRDIEVAGCTSAHRLVWRTSFRVYDPNWASALTAKTVYVYIDNIKVSIKK